MSYSIAQIRRFNFANMLASQGQVKAAEAKIVQGTETYARAMKRMTNGWGGDAREAAVAHVAQRNQTGAELSKATNTMAREIGLVAEEMTAARTRVLAIVERVKSHGFHVNEDTGEVTPAHLPQPHGTGFTPMKAAAEAAKLEAVAAGLQALIGQALQRFDGKDATNAAALGAPGITSVTEQATIAQVDSGAPLTPQLALAALQIPSNEFTAASRSKLASWAQEQRTRIGNWIRDGRKLFLPPAPQGGYSFRIVYSGGDNMRLIYDVAVPAGAAMVGVAFAKGGAKPGLSGVVQKPGVSGDVGLDDGGFSASALGDTPNGGGMGITVDSEGAWLVAKHATALDPENIPGASTAGMEPQHRDGEITTTLELRPDAKLPPNVQVAQPNPLQRFAHYESHLTKKAWNHWSHWANSPESRPYGGSGMGGPVGGLIGTIERLIGELG